MYILIQLFYCYPKIVFFCMESISLINNYQLTANEIKDINNPKYILSDQSSFFGILNIDINNPKPINLSIYGITDDRKAIGEKLADVVLTPSNCKTLTINDVSNKYTDDIEMITNNFNYLTSPGYNKSIQLNNHQINDFIVYSYNNGQINITLQKEINKAITILSIITNIKDFVGTFNPTSILDELCVKHNYSYPKCYKLALEYYKSHVSDDDKENEAYLGIVFDKIHNIIDRIEPNGSTATDLYIQNIITIEPVLSTNTYGARWIYNFDGGSKLIIETNNFIDDEIETSITYIDEYGFSTSITEHKMYIFNDALIMNSSGSLDVSDLVRGIRYSCEKAESSVINNYRNLIKNNPKLFDTQTKTSEAQSLHVALKTWITVLEKENINSKYTSKINSMKKTLNDTTIFPSEFTSCDNWNTFITNNKTLIKELVCFYCCYKYVIYTYKYIMYNKSGSGYEEIIFSSGLINEVVYSSIPVCKNDLQINVTKYPINNKYNAMLIRDNNSNMTFHGYPIHNYDDKILDELVRNDVIDNGDGLYSVSTDLSFDIVK